MSSGSEGGLSDVDRVSAVVVAEGRTTMGLTVKDLVDRLDAMTAESIRQAGRLTRGEHRTAADEIAWWSATVRVERLVRYERQRQAAATAASVARRAVKHAASRCGLAPDDPDVIATARAASDAAGAIVAGRGALAELHYFVERLGFPSTLISASASAVAA
jgi:hypothetical protein